MISINVNMWIVGDVWMLDMEWTAMNIEIHTTWTKTHVIQGNHILGTIQDTCHSITHKCKKKHLNFFWWSSSAWMWELGILSIWFYLKSLTTVGWWWHLAIVHKTCFNLQHRLEQMKKSRLHGDAPWCTNVETSKAYPSCSNLTQCRSRTWP